MQSILNVMYSSISINNDYKFEMESHVPVKNTQKLWYNIQYIIRLFSHESAVQTIVLMFDHILYAMGVTYGLRIRISVLI